MHLKEHHHHHDDHDNVPSSPSRSVCPPGCWHTFPGSDSNGGAKRTPGVGAKTGKNGQKRAKTGKNGPVLRCVLVCAHSEAGLFVGHAIESGPALFELFGVYNQAHGEQCTPLSVGSLSGS